MKPRLIHLFLTLALLLGSVAAFAQGKVYTRKVRLGDFPTRTVKVVAEGNSFLALALREADGTSRCHKNNNQHDRD